MAKFNISIVIPNWNGKELLEKHLPSVLKSMPKNSEIVVVDDGSIDHSVEILQSKFPQVVIVQKEIHEGFASSANAGVDASGGDIVVLLNTDIEPEVNFIEHLLVHFDDPKVFAVGCMDKSVEGEQVILRGRGQVRWHKGFYIHSKGKVNRSDTAWVSGGSGAFRKSIWEKLGGMDTLFNPFYWEDIDLSYRALKAGYKIFFESASVVIHKHEEGVIKKLYSKFQVRTTSYRNQFIFIWKNISDSGFFLSHLFWTPFTLVKSIISGDFAMIVGFTWALFILPRVVKARRDQSRIWKISDRVILRSLS